MSGVAAAGESRVETTLERVLSDPLCTVRTVSAVSAVSVSAAVTAVTGAGLAVAASVLGVRVRAEPVSAAEAVLTVVSEASAERASEAAGKAATVAGAAEAVPTCAGKRSLLVPAERTGDLLE